MTDRSFPFDSDDGDRPLNTQRWADLTASIVPVNGVVPGFADELEVTATSPESLAVEVQPGRMLIQGRLYEVIDAETVELDAADTSNPRVDRIVVRRDLTLRTVTVGVVTGTPGVSPSAPALTQVSAGVWEEPLATVFVRANATSIRNSDLQDGQGFIQTDQRGRLRLRGGTAVGDDDLVPKAQLETYVNDETDNIVGEIVTTGSTINLVCPVAGGYRDLLLVMNGGHDGPSFVNGVMRLNNITASDYGYSADYRDFGGTSGDLSSTAASGINIPLIGAFGGNSRGQLAIRISRYSQNGIKAVTWDGVGRIGSAGSGGRVGRGGGVLQNTAAVTEVRIVVSGVFWATGTRLTAYGIGKL